MHSTACKNKLQITEIVGDFELHKSGCIWRHSLRNAQQLSDWSTSLSHGHVGHRLFEEGRAFYEDILLLFADLEYGCNRNFWHDIGLISED